MTSGPIPWISPVIVLSKPRIRLVTPTTMVMPMTMPSTVSAERILWVRRLSHAIPMISPVSPLRTRNAHS